MAYEQWPYTNFHDLNLDWIMGKISELEDLVKKYPDTQKEIEAALAELQKQFAEYDAEIVPRVNAILKERIASMILPYITEGGNIAFHIPDGWETVTFHTTGLDIVLPLYPEYGRLVIDY